MKKFKEERGRIEKETGLDPKLMILHKYPCKKLQMCGLKKENRLMKKNSGRKLTNGQFSHPVEYFKKSIS